MIGLFFKTIWRSIRVDVFYASIKLVGLALGFAVFILIVVYAQHEYSYEKWNSNSDRIYRVEMHYKSLDGTVDRTIISPSDLALKLQEDIPEIEHITRFNGPEMGERLLSNEAKKGIYIDHILSSDSIFFQMYKYRFIYGDAATALVQPNSMVLTLETTNRLFGNINPLGKKVYVSSKYEYVVTGVVDTKETYGHFKFDGLRNLKEKHNTWNNYNYYSYVMLKKNSDKEEVERKAKQAVLKIEGIANELKEQNGIESFAIKLLPIEAIHLHSADDNELEENGNAFMVNLLLVLAALILVISFINFTNLSVVQTINRAREIALKKVNGASKRQINWQFFSEQLVLVFLAALLGVVVTELSLPWFNQFFNLELQLSHAISSHAYIALSLIGIVVVFASIAGLYPVSLVLHYPASLVLKGSFSNSNKGTWLRNSLLIVQFAIASIFMICLWIVSKQVHYIKSKDVGFNADQVLMVKIHGGNSLDNFLNLKARLKNTPHVKEVSACNDEPGVSRIQTQGRTHKGRTLTMALINIDFDYFKVLNIKLKAGRFLENIAGDSMAIVLNEAAVKEFGLKEPLTEVLFDVRPVVGVIKDFNQKKVDVPIVPTGFVFNSGGGPKNKLLIKYDSQHTSEVIAAIESVLKEYEPDYPMRYSFLDKEYAKLYRQHERLEQLFLLFTSIIVLVALVGLFAIAAYMVQQRTRELAIRKVLGASPHQLLGLLQRHFIGLAILGNAIAIPIAYFFTSQWLERFSYRIELPLLPFIISIFLSLLITAIIVSFQAWRVAATKPIAALKYN